LIINRQDCLKHWGDEAVDIFDVYLKRDQAADESRSILRGEDPELERRRQAVKESIRQKLGGAFDLQILTRPELQTRIQRMIQQIYGVAYGQQIVVMLVAALGVVTSLLISVLQRRREMGLLRAIGASRFQVVKSVLCEACLMGLIGTVIGLLVGLPLQWYVLEVIILDESGFLFPMYIPWKEGLIISAGSMLTATLAGLGPALHAVRQRIPDAIAYE
jgi:putative ABC transport system permease protein